MIIFTPKIGQRYWFVDGGGSAKVKPVLMWPVYYGSFADFLRLRAENCFRIRVDARKALESWLIQYNQL